MERTDPIITVIRPADGNYRLPEEKVREVYSAIFGADYAFASAPDSLLHRLHTAIWANLSHLHMQGLKCEVDGWTRPFVDILLDIIEAGRRAPVERTWSMMRMVLGEELAAEFMPVLAAAPVHFFTESQYLSDVNPVGFRRVGPHPDDKVSKLRFTHEELKILNTVMTDRGGWPAVDNLVRKLAEAVS